MNRLKLLVAAALLGLPLAACEEGTRPTPVGQIDGQVVIEGEGIDGVSVTLSSGAATTTSGGGHYSFADVEGGTYTITISGYPADASFNATTAEVTIASAGQTASASFSGAWIRTASLMGMVAVEGEGLPGITVSITGRQDAQMLTDDNGQYTFTGLRAGNYTVEISGFDATDVGFSSTSSAVQVAVGESKVWSFDGTYVRESVIAGQVSVEGNGLAGVTVSLQGMGDDDEQNTDVGGQFTFSNLRAGQYQLAISGYDTDEYGFSTTSATIRVEHGRTANVPFEGIMLRTAGIMGRVSVEGEGLADVTVSLSGEGESHTTMTDNSGQYAFSDLPAGNFQVGISGYDTDDYSFETTSQNVALALGETARVAFEGILLRTSGISGRVSVEGTGLASVTVTLSGDDLEDDVTMMTDATGQYAFAGLAEGDYTVAISGYDDVAYNFAMTSMDVDLGDDDTEIVNFTGTHARTAMISGMVYVDEAGKNDSYDEGEHALAAPGIALALVGPGILDQTLGATGPDGSFSFGELRAGPYQLVVANSAAAGPDYAYGGPAEGYGFALGVGDEETQNIPFDITHTTVNFSVNLRSGDDMGAALPGATVSFYSDMAGKVLIGDATTNANGVASMRIARSMASNHTVYASVAAPAGDYHPAMSTRQAVMWDAQMTMHAASNDADIVNLKADFSFGGATIETDFGGGKALGGWAITIGSDKSAAADTPDKLGANGSASYSEVVMADLLPVTYTVNLAADQANTLDGGSKYDAGDGLEYTHDGLSLPATMNAGMMEVAYTTQTLKVYVHNERDQVMGFTGNILGGDIRMSGKLDVGIRHIERSSGRSRAFPSTPASARIGKSDRNGVVTFTNVPASAQVIVQVSVVANENIKLLGEDELDAYTGHDDNGMTGGAFGDEGGFHHTVELCPLISDDGDQRHGECGTFAFVNTHHVFGQVWENSVALAGDGGFGSVAKTPFAGVTVGMDPVPNENLAGDSDSYTSGTDNTRTPVNEAVHFDWDRKAAGEYKVSVPGGWIAKMGTPDDATNTLADAISPLAADLQIDVSPTTGYLYGIVEDGKGFRVEGATVTANGRSATTDAFGRYRIRGFGPATINRVANRVGITVAIEGFKNGTGNIAFASNAPGQEDFTLSGTDVTATVAGTVRSGGEAVEGAEIKVNGSAPLNAVRGKLLTGDDGSYSALVDASSGTAVITVTKARMSFAPESHTVTVSDGLSITGLDFAGFAHGTISGRVLNENGGPMAGVTVTATPTAGGDAADEAETKVSGEYSLSVPFGRYTVAASKAGYNFSSAQDVNVGPGESKSIEDFESTAISSDAMLSALSLSAGDLSPTFAGDVFAYTASVDNDVESTTVTATANDAGASVAISPADADDSTDGHQIDLDVGDNEITVTVTAANGGTADYTVTVTRAASSDNSLSALSLSDVTLTPAFASGTTEYTATVANEIASTTVEATANDADNASVSIAPADASMLEMGHQVDLDVGDNVITVTVTAADGTTQDYAVTVTRPISTDATLSALSLSDIMFSPAFDSDIEAYTATVGYDYTETRVDATASHESATMAIVPADADADAANGHQVALRVGSNVITVRVTAEDGTTERDYTVTVTRDVAPSSDATLSALTLSGVDLTFDPATTTYTASVGNEVDETTVDARQTHSSASVAISPADADAAADGHQVALGVGDTEITVTVTAENGAVQEYTVTVNRAQSSDATLSEVTVNGEVVPPDDATGNYATGVADDVTMATITASPNHSEASVTVVPEELALNIGDNTATVVVVAEDGTRADYTVTVTRAAPNSSATGKPTISGRARIGETLTANVRTIRDLDGMTNATLAYQWISVASDGAESDIAHATSMIHDAVEADAGNMLKVTVSFTDDRGFDESVTSDPTAVVNSPATGEVAISGTAKVGEILTADASGINDADGMTNATLSYQWISVGADDAETNVGTDQNTYAPVVGDVGNTIKVTVSFTDDLGQAESVTSDPTAVVNSPATGEVAISGTAKVGEILTADASGINDADGMTNATLSYQWISVGADDAETNVGTDQNTYAPVVGDVGNTIKVTVSFTDDLGQAESVTSVATRPVAAADPAIVISSADDDGDGDPTTIALGEGGDGGMYMVSLATEPTADVTVDIATHIDDDGVADDVSAFMTHSVSSRTFTPSNWNVPQAVTIEAPEDDADTESHDVTLRHTAASTDAEYQAKTADIAVAVADDDANTPAIRVGAVGAFAENAAAADRTFTVALGAADGSTGKPVGGDVTVTIPVPADAGFSLSADGSSLSDGGEFELTFNEGNFYDDQTVTVIPVDDEIQSRDGSAVTLTATATGGGYEENTNVTQPVADSVDVTITEDDVAGVTVSPTALQVMEGGTGSYTIKLNSDPGGAVTITAVSGTPATAQVSPNVLTFNSANWEDEQTVTVTAVDNTATDGNATVTITNSILSAPAGNGYTAGDAGADNVTATVVDDETAQVLVNPTALSIAPGANGTFEVRLTRAPDAGETVTITVVPATGLSGATVLTFTAADWSAKTVTIGVLSTTAAGNLTVTNTLSTTAVSAGYSAATAPNVEVTVTAGN